MMAMKTNTNKELLNKIFTTLLLLIWGSIITGCDDNLADSSNNVYSVTTIEVSDVGLFSAVLHANVNIPKSFGNDYTVGFQLSTDSLFPVDLTHLCIADVVEQDGSFSFSIYRTIGNDIDMPLLNPETQYYVRAFIKFDNVAYVGGVKSFKTIPLEIITGAMDPKTNTVSCQVNLFNEDSWISGILGVCYSYTHTPTIKDSIVSILDNDIALKSDGTFSVIIDDLLYADTIYYRAFYRDKGIVYYGNTQYGETRSGPKLVTLSAEKGPFMVAFLYGRVNGLTVDTIDFERGIEYSTDESFSVGYTFRQKVDNIYSEDPYKISISEVQPGKKYYYRAYYINQQLFYHGLVKSFAFEWTAPNVTTLSAELNEFGAVIMKGLVKDKSVLVKELSSFYPDGYYGIEYSTTQTFDVNSSSIIYLDKSTDKNIENDSVICKITQFDYDSTYYYRTFFRLGEIQSYGEVKSFKFDWGETKIVDLGLSVKWATLNVGATYPWDYGDYFAWGETESKTDYSWSTYKYCNGSYYTLTKYNSNSSYGTVDNKTALDLDDDAAHVNWGGNWRMPTKAEINELLNSDNCIWSIITLRGVKGFLVTSKKAGYEGASIFLPATGYRYDVFFGNVGSYGDYWSSSINSDYPYYAWFLFHFPGNRGSGSYYRSYGRSIRPVCP